MLICITCAIVGIGSLYSKFILSPRLLQVCYCTIYFLLKLFMSSFINYLFLLFSVVIIYSLQIYLFCEDPVVKNTAANNIIK